MKKGGSKPNPGRERAFGQICFLATRDIPDIQSELTDCRAAVLLRGIQEKPEIEALSEGLQSQYNHPYSRCQVFSDKKTAGIDSFCQTHTRRCCNLQDSQIIERSVFSPRDPPTNNKKAPGASPRGFLINLRSVLLQQVHGLGCGVRTSGQFVEIDSTGDVGGIPGNHVLASIHLPVN